MVDILLSTYNGEKFLSKQLDSIINQSYLDWNLIIRDDGSTDNTISIINDYVRKYPTKIFYLDDKLGNLKTTFSFETLIRSVKSNYFMLCDQDDIWIKNKISKSLDVMNGLEKEYTNRPLLVCSDAICIDEEDNIISPSFYKSQKFEDTENHFEKMLALNIVQGSTCILNKESIKYILPIPQNLFHDHWIAVVNSIFGKTMYIHEPLMMYRQHKSNVVGANDISYSYFYRKLKRFTLQMDIYITMYKYLPIKPNILKWVYYKIIYTIKRLK